MGDYHWRLEVDETQIDPDYFVEAMALSETRRQIEDATVGSTSAGKISQASLATIEIPVPSLERQRRFLGLARPVHEVLAGCTAEAAAAEQLRISLIEELLGHELSHRFKGGIA
jgi:restriction endonuclease S subunit